MKRVIVSLCLSAGCLLAQGPVKGASLTSPPDATKISAAPAADAARAVIPVGDAVYGWRGDGSGCFPGATPCTVWGGPAKSNVLWAAETEKSYAGPIVAGGNVLVTAEPDILVCVSRTDGKILWRKRNEDFLTPEQKAAIQDVPTTQAGLAVATPVTDGKKVYASFGSGVIVCYDLDGNLKWLRLLHAEDHPAEAGHCASPLLVGGRLIVTYGGLVALNPATGDTVWTNPATAEAYGTPAAAKIGDAQVLVTAAGDCVSVKEGKTLATRLYREAPAYPSPVISGGVAYFCARTITAVKLPAGMGDAFEKKPLWTAELEADVFGSPICVDGLLYVVDDARNFYVLDARTGKEVYKQTLELAEDSPLYGSMVLAGGHIILGNVKGDLMVLEPGRKFKRLQTNSLDGGEGCCPAFAGDQMFLRADGTLYCIAQQKKK